MVRRLSDDSTPEIIVGLSKKDDRIIYLKNDAQTTPHALNLGIKNATGEITIILGAHAELHPDYVQNCVSILEKTLK